VIIVAGLAIDPHLAHREDLFKRRTVSGDSDAKNLRDAGAVNIIVTHSRSLARGSQ
jgi:hypothetical protein